LFIHIFLGKNVLLPKLTELLYLCIVVMEIRRIHCWGSFLGTSCVEKTVKVLSDKQVTLTGYYFK